MAGIYAALPVYKIGNGFHVHSLFASCLLYLCCYLFKAAYQSPAKSKFRFLLCRVIRRGSESRVRQMGLRVRICLLRLQTRKN